ncbi:MAG: hypothetical protein OEW15_18940, partial [Nitrospirota bacterium]|nr:hypothetical protein [Nitrospirota bacterium]
NRRTCELKGGTNVSNNTVVAAPGNDVLDALNRMLPQAAGGDGSAVHQGTDPAAASRAALQPGELVYCLREVDAKNLMINFSMCRAWGGDMYEILSTYQTGTR